MPQRPPTCPLTSSQVLDLYFAEHRAKLLDLAAFLDRIDRAGGDEQLARQDVRLRALLAGLAILDDGQGERARRLLELWSDPTTEPLERAPGKGALGVYPGFTEKP